jgi:two-component system, OmpR family, alkaline phosphatase synthesis response regulator PhoP
MKEFIVLVEDELDILELVEYSLKKEGYDVEGFLDTSRVEELLSTENVDLLIMDRNLPQIDGVEFVKNLRKKGFQTPVIFLTAKTEDSHKIEGLEAGADDYIVKPFNVSEMLLRVKAVIRRTSNKKETLQHKDIVMMLDSQQVFIGEKEVFLTKLEFNLLSELIKNKNIVLSRDTLLSSVWRDEEIYQDRTVDVAVKRLKEKIDYDKTKNYINSVRGVGYKLC